MVPVVVVLFNDAFSIFTVGTTAAGVLLSFLLQEIVAKLNTTINDRSAIFCSIIIFFTTLSDTFCFFVRPYYFRKGTGQNALCDLKTDCDMKKTTFGERCQL